MSTSLKIKFNRPTLYGLCVALALLALGSCQVRDPEISEDLLGRWRIEKIDAYLDESSAPALTKTQDYTGKDLYFEFLKDGKFVTNTDLGLNNILLEGGEGVLGNYDFTESRNKNIIILSFYDPQYDTPVELNFEVVDISTDTPSLVMDKTDYVTSLRNSGNNMNDIFRNNLYDFSSRIKEARFSWTFTKI